MKKEILRITNLSKKIQEEDVLNNINLTVYAGEIHVLIGRNGTGKTTIVQLLNGNMKEDRGQIYFQERRVHIGSMKDAKALGIGYVGQETRYVSTMNVAENIFLLNQEKNPFVWRERSQNIKARHYLDMAGLQEVETTARSTQLNTAQKKCVELARELSTGASFIILDEFMSTMTQEEETQAMQVINRLRNMGITFFMITNKLKEAYELADRITVMRQGNTCYTLRKSEYTKEELMKHLLGGPEVPLRIKKEETSKVLMTVENLAAGWKVKDVSFELHAGEIIAFIGHGKKELMQSLYGLKKIYRGSIHLEGRQVKIRSPKEARKHGIGYMPQNRKQQGLVDSMKVKENMSMGVLKKVSFLGIINRRVEHNFVKAQARKIYIEDLLEKETENISKGNQQKILLAKCLMLNPKVLILMNPTEGVDGQSSREIQKVLLQMAKQGIGILMCSDDIETIYHCADRILHFKEGEIKSAFRISEQTMEKMSGIIEV